MSRQRLHLGSVLRDCRGAVLLEFVFIVVPLLVVLIGVILSGINLSAAMAFDNATREAATAMMWADSTARGTDDTQVRKLICSKMATFLPCGSLGLYVASGPTCSTLTAALVVNGTLSMKGYSPGTPNSCVLLQAAVPSPLGLSPLIPNNNGPVLMSTVVFMNEPL